MNGNPPIPVRWSLTPEQMDFAIQVAQKRHAANTADQRTSIKCDPSSSDFFCNLVGALGEVAVSVTERRPIRCPVHSGSGFLSATNGPDVGDWEIKTTTAARPRLMVPVPYPHKHHPERKYLLVQALRSDHHPGLQPHGFILGWAFGHEFLHPDFIDHSLPVPAFVAPTLHPYVSTVPNVGSGGGQPVTIDPDGVPQ